jgi:hypothetical protein
MREALVRSMAEAAGVETDGHSELWLKQPLKKRCSEAISFATRMNRSWYFYVGSRNSVRRS